MNKKTYIQPAVNTVVMASQSMIASSLGNGETKFSGEKQGTKGDFGDSKASGSWGVWDDNDY